MTPLLRATITGLVLTSLMALLPRSASAQAAYRITVIPSAPSPADLVSLRVDASCPGIFEDVAVDGTTITLVHTETNPPMGAPCSTALPYGTELSIGKLETGSYRVELFFRHKDGTLSSPTVATFEVTSIRRYEVNPGTLVEGCGGIAFQCHFFGLGGWLEVDTEAAAITGSELELHQTKDVAFPFPAADDLPFSELVGTIEEGVWSFVSPAGSRQLVELSLSPIEDGLVLNGVYDEGCCDRFAFQFSNVLLRPLREPATTLALRDERFEVIVEWNAFSGQRGHAAGSSLSFEAAWFWFFEPSNPELLVKVLDGCDSFGHFWLFAAGLTNVGVEITVEDTWTGMVRRYVNPVGQQFEPVLDVTAFDTCTAVAHRPLDLGSPVLSCTVALARTNSLPECLR